MGNPQGRPQSGNPPYPCHGDTSPECIGGVRWTRTGVRKESKRDRMIQLNVFGTLCIYLADIWYVVVPPNCHLVRNLAIFKLIEINE